MVARHLYHRTHSSKALSFFRALVPVHPDGIAARRQHRGRGALRPLKQRAPRGPWALGVCVTLLLVGWPMRGYSQNVAATVTAGTNPESVAVNPVTNQVYVGNAASSNVTVINGANNTVSATVTVGTAPFAMAVNPVTNKIYVANVTSSNVTVIDGNFNTTATTTMLTVGTTPNAVAVNPTTNQIYVTNGGSANVTVINGATSTSAATVDSTVAVGTMS
jgi:YVTN family beta-propeller protein